MPRVITKIGDIFSVNIGDNKVKCFQYVANDLTQLNSDVIRIFKKTYPLDSEIDLPELVSGEIEFHAHCVTKFGVKLGFWKKIGNIPVVGKVEALFRDTEDYGIRVGEEPIKVSNNWYVWKLNEEFRYVGKLVGENQKAEIGLVMNPVDIVCRMRTGEYNFRYPGYETNRLDHD